CVVACAPLGDAGEHVVGDPGPVGGHGVLTADGTQHDRVTIGTALTLYPHRTHIGQQHHRALPDVSIQSGAGEFLPSDGIGLTQDLQTFTGHVTDDSNPQTGAGERLAPHHLGRQAEFLTDFTDLVLEQFPQRLHQGEPEILGESTHVVVGLDVGRTGAGTGLDHARVQGALHQELDLGVPLAALGDDLPGGLLEGPDELTADDLAFALGIAHPGKGGEELLLRIDHLEFGAGGRNEVLVDLFGLTLAQQAVVDEHASELFTDGTLHKSPGHCRVHAPAQSTDGAFVTDLLTDPFDLFLNDVDHR